MTVCVCFHGSQGVQENNLKIAHVFDCVMQARVTSVEQFVFAGFQADNGNRGFVQTHYSVLMKTNMTEFSQPDHCL